MRLQFVGLLFYINPFNIIFLVFCSKDRAAALAAGPHKEAWSKGPSYEDLYTQDVVISMEEQEDLQRAATEGKPVKERPIWLRESTVQGGTYSESTDIKDGEWRGRAALDRLLLMCQSVAGNGATLRNLQGIPIHSSLWFLPVWIVVTDSPRAAVRTVPCSRAIVGRSHFHLIRGRGR